MRRLLKSLRLVRVASRALKYGDVLTLGALALDAAASVRSFSGAARTGTSYIYVLSNVGQLGYKVGYSNNIERRIEELTTTGVAYRFVAEAWFPVPEPTVRDVERRVHTALARHRIGAERGGVLPEMFLLPVDEIVAVIVKTLGITDPNAYYYRRRPT